MKRIRILKERLFGLTNREGNHGEDVKEYYYYLDATPTSSYLKFLYKYPQAAFPYDQLREENAKRTRHQPEYELIDTGVFAENRYFDIFVEYAKVTSEDIVVRITAWNRGPEAGAAASAALAVVSQSLGLGRSVQHAASGARRGIRRRRAARADRISLRPALAADRRSAGTALHRERNEHGASVRSEEQDSLREGCLSPLPDQWRTRCRESRDDRHKSRGAFRFGNRAGTELDDPLRLTDQNLAENHTPAREFFGPAFDAIFDQRKKEADEFYDKRIDPELSEDARLVQRQAFAGLLWCKQSYHYDVRRWLEGDSTQPTPDPAATTAAIMSGRTSTIPT